MLIEREQYAGFETVIAPTDFTDELDLYLYLSASVQQQFDIAKEAVYKDTTYQLPEDWWSVWRCEILTSDPSGEQHAVLFTNSATFFSFICHGFSDDFDALVSEFEGAFLSSLKAQGLQLPSNVSTQTRLIRGNPRRLVGTMKELKGQALAIASCPDGPVPPAEIERRLQHRPCSSLKEIFPDYEYLKQLKANPPFGADFDDTDDVIVPFPGCE
ncbi:Unannotated [Lentimonas sp. CC19]|nr:Unannotated [Lentimonas sp. CC10]CAA6696960.1 Unannotated [Lentimonas sp. CC19]CAA7071117.1 Unannotated [Lentimonas sp. CC11]